MYRGADSRNKHPQTIVEHWAHGPERNGYDPNNSLTNAPAKLLAAV